MARGRRFQLLAITGVATAFVAAASSAHADDDGVRHRTSGEDLARAGKFEEAIGEFKRADQADPRAQHACLIGLAYARLQQWGLADAYLVRCQVRSTREDPVPSWTADLRAKVDAAVAAGGFGRLRVRIEPDGAGATFTVSVYPADERFASGTLVVPVGTHRLEVHHDGYAPHAETVEIDAGEDTTIVVTLEPSGAERDVAAPDPTPTPTRVPAAPSPAGARRSVWTWVTLGTGGAALATGVTFHALALQSRRRLADAADGDEYDDREGAFERRRLVTLGAYGVAAIATAVGAYLYVRTPRRGQDWRVGGALGDGAAVVTLELRR